MDEPSKEDLRLDTMSRRRDEATCANGEHLTHGAEGARLFGLPPWS